MNVQMKRNKSPFVVVSFCIGLLLVLFIPASLYMLWGSFFQLPLFIISLPMIGIVCLAICYLKSKKPLESLSHLILIDGIVFLLYFICIFLIFYTLIDPLVNFFFYFLILNGLYSIYIVLLIPLVGIVILTFYHIILNLSIGRLKLSMHIIFLSVIIIVFIVIYNLLNSSIPILEDFYLSLPDYPLD